MRREKKMEREKKKKKGGLTIIYCFFSYGYSLSVAELLNPVICSYLGCSVEILYPPSNQITPRTLIPVVATVVIKC